MLKNSTQPAGGGNVMYPGKVPGKIKYTFAFGALGKDMIYGMIATFSMIYFTDIIKVAPAFIGIMFFAAKIWDAFNDLQGTVFEVELPVGMPKGKKEDEKR